MIFEVLNHFSLYQRKINVWMSSGLRCWGPVRDQQLDVRGWTSLKSRWSLAVV